MCAGHDVSCPYEHETCPFVRGGMAWRRGAAPRGRFQAAELLRRGGPARRERRMVAGREHPQLLLVARAQNVLRLLFKLLGPEGARAQAPLRQAPPPEATGSFPKAR